MNREIKHCSECKHSIEREKERLYCSRAPNDERLAAVTFQRNSYWLHDCGPAGHFWEPKDAQ